MISAIDHDTTTHTASGILHESADKLATVSSTPRLDAELIVSHVTGLSRTRLFGWPETPVTGEHVKQIALLVEDRLTGKPLAYLLGTQEFWSLPFKVTPATLVPRPETELLVEAALGIIPKNRPCRVADLGTGSGIIATVISLERPASTVFACDKSIAALNVARHNMKTNGAKGVHLWAGNWLEAVGGQFDVIVSNPPYISYEEASLCSPETRHEPESALFAENHGLSDIETIICQAENHLADNGWLLFEHGFKQGEKARKLLSINNFSEISTISDLSGHERISLGRAQKLDLL